MNGRRGSVLVGLLWCLALLSVIVTGLLYSARLDLRVVKNYGDTIQAHYLALAGIEKAKAVLYHDAANRRRSAQNHSGAVYSDPEQFRDVTLGRGLFRIIRQAGPGEGQGIVYGVSDEESRLNLNQASKEELPKLPGIEQSVVSAILDFRDEDNGANPGGAEDEYYQSLQPPYLPRNGPLQTVREMLMVAGVTARDFMGEDANQNGLLDPEEDDGDAAYPPDNKDGLLDAGWSGLLTVDSSVRDVNAAGEARVNIRNADESALAAVPGLSSTLAKAIVAYRGQNQFNSLADLLEVRALTQQPQAPPQQNPPPNAGGPDGAPVQQNPPPRQPAAQPTGNPLISEELFMDIADDLTAAQGPDLGGVVNVNTAGAEVLACLPGIDEILASAIVSYRRSAGFLPNIACLLKVPGMTRDIFKQVAPRVTARSETYRILSEGVVSSTQARQRIQAIVRVGSTEIETVSYREDL